MKNELNFIVAVVLTLIILTCYPMLMQKFFPDQFPDKSAQTTQQPDTQNVTQKTSETVPPIAKQAEVKSAIYSKQKSYTLKSDKFLVTVNAPQADISRIELNDILDPASKQPTTIMEAEKNSPGIFADFGLTDSAKLENSSIVDAVGVFNYKLGNGLSVTKTIMLSDKTYQIKGIYQIINPTDKDISLEYRMIAATGVPEANRIASRFRDVVAIFKKGNFKKNFSSLRKTEEKSGEVEMAGFKLKYFSLVMVPFGAADKFIVDPAGDSRKTTAGIEISRVVVPAGGKLEQKYVLYAGPNDFDEMKALGVGVEQIRGTGFFAGFSDLLLFMLRSLNGIFRNYGLAVIALALIVNLFLYPLTLKSMRSMKEMQVLQPKVEALKAKYGNDTQKLNKEIVELYRSHNVNYADGCLPILLQMPVFFTLYGVLMRAIELRGAQFLWIKDLASPDAFIVLSSNFPFIGNKINLLPLLMMAVSVVQQKMMTKGQPANDQQKAMAMVMPLVLGVIFYNFPSGLVLYFLTNTIFSFGVQMRLKKVGNA